MGGPDAEAGRRGKDRIHCFRIADGSARETRAGLQIAVDWGYVVPQPEVDARLDRLCGLLWRLCNPR